MRKILTVLVSGLAITVYQPAFSQVPELVTDRPDQTESSRTVPVKKAQLELGWVYVRHNSTGQNLESHNFPSSLLRLGIAERVELRLGWDGHTWNTLAGAKSEESGNISLGGKVQLVEEMGLRPEMALLGAFSTTRSAHPPSDQKWDHSLRLSLAHSLSERLGLGYNLGYSAEASDQNQTETFFIYTASLGMELFSKTGAFVEVFGSTFFEGSSTPESAVDGGITYLVADNLQLDFAAGLGMSQASPDWSLGAGVSLRVPE